MPRIDELLLNMANAWPQRNRSLPRLAPDSTRSRSIAEP
jgi:hypothetical protein